jgi:hypothetical protein
MRYDVYKFAGFNPREEVPVFHLWQGDVRLDELFRQFGFVVVKDKLRDLRHLEGIFLTPELYLIPTGKKPHIVEAALQKLIGEIPSCRFTNI